jgi:hypothetical protein
VGRAATVLVALPRERPSTSKSQPSLVSGAYIMKAVEPKTPQEPVGIVISGHPRQPQPSVFSAYVWGPPNTAEDKASKTV